ncbi:hypothetical protein CONPUDRAFT_157404 [Coniophora puteana RWD-64-598 SS2]|uniref:Uncharacterized protein n=1 Tax=Coniophora puteana (strain RWD-64-598) TaxID=741705 RepID=A0A5M3MDS0_CONPW|nr:uncharacterized protein CONPUDRAFT_157404 [Coniophora puteana RWD-64-598 SS2]EIW77136.1 hypothetical protein CONPUDRAFT_157404 [Coniophora puteana RWD-64-598 SS2]
MADLYKFMKEDFCPVMESEPVFAQKVCHLISCDREYSAIGSSSGIDYAADRDTIYESLTTSHPTWLTHVFEYYNYKIFGTPRASSISKGAKKSPGDPTPQQKCQEQEKAVFAVLEKHYAPKETPADLSSTGDVAPSLIELTEQVNALDLAPQAAGDPDTLLVDALPSSTSIFAVNGAPTTTNSETMELISTSGTQSSIGVPSSSSMEVVPATTEGPMQNPEPPELN